ncbi:MAG: STAS/SEC14 domain-containing protein [Candidatus Devosia symbiotica]|nr:STAS/SEC14 domain-containing protein [Candidatus Devosia symbiotica]
MLYTITDFSLPTLGAIGVEMSLLSKLFGMLIKFDKCAVLTNIAWLRAAATIEGALYPGLDIKSYILNERDAAKACLAANDQA